MATRKTTSKSSSATKSTTSSKTAKTPKVTTARKTVKIAPKVAKPAETKAPEATVAAETVDTSVEAAAETVETTQTHLRKRALVNAVAERSGVKRRDAKAAIEAAMEIMGEAIADGRGLNLPGLGKMKVVRTKKLANAHVYVTRIRQSDKSMGPGPENGDKDPLAEAAE